jgi:peptidoglycan hydrolase-like protein with peptidoglycan-binding domain
VNKRRGRPDTIHAPRPSAAACELNRAVAITRAGAPAALLVPVLAGRACPCYDPKNRIVGGLCPCSSQEVTVNITLPELKAGDQDKPEYRMVHRLQGLVSALGNPVAMDGIFGPNTEAAVKDQQRDFGLPVTGVVDDNTWIKLVEG